MSDPVDEKDPDQNANEIDVEGGSSSTHSDDRQASSDGNLPTRESFEAPQYVFQAATPVLEPNPPEPSNDTEVDSAESNSNNDEATESSAAQTPRRAEPTPNETPSQPGHATAQSTGNESGPANGSDGGQGANPDEQLIQQTKMQIRGLVSEIQKLAQSNCSIEEFNEGFLTRVTSALASVGGGIWKVGENGRLDLQYQVNLAATELADGEKAQAAHDLLLRRIIQNNEPVIIPPHSGSGDSEDAANPTSCLLVVERLVVDQRVVGLVEVFQRAGSGPTTQRGYLRFLVQMCEIASDFLKNRKIRNYQQQQELWENWNSLFVLLTMDSIRGKQLIPLSMKVDGWLNVIESVSPRRKEAGFESK